MVGGGVYCLLMMLFAFFIAPWDGVFRGKGVEFV
jgi:hypothetical protein